MTFSCFNVIGYSDYTTSTPFSVSDKMLKKYISKKWLITFIFNWKYQMKIDIPVIKSLFTLCVIRNINSKCSGCMLWPWVMSCDGYRNQRIIDLSIADYSCVSLQKQYPTSNLLWLYDKVMTGTLFGPSKRNIEHGNATWKHDLDKNILNM